VTNAPPYFSAKNMSDDPWRYISIEVLNNAALRGENNLISTWYGDEDFMGKKTTLYRMGKFSGKWSGKEMIFFEHMHVTNRTFYSWHLLLKVNATNVKVKIDGDEDFASIESVWRTIIDSINIE
jgi:hypothetical protein